MIRFSIITIVRNDPVGVIRTLQSVFSQTYQNYELIVQDGASTDETSDVLRSFGDWIDNLTIEKDNGIYDAMNRALRRATGDYLLFLNAADFFFDAKVLKNISEKINIEKDDLFAGVSVRDEDGLPHKFRVEGKHWLGNTFDHQAVFIRRSIIQGLEYNVRYKISADLDFFTRARLAGCSIRYDDTKVVRKPYSVGASAAFFDRVSDRLRILGGAYGADYAVSDEILSEARSTFARDFDIPHATVAGHSLDELLIQAIDWGNLLR